MGRVEKTVFICYRRTNVPWALAIYQNLTTHGYDVFFDYQSIKSGDFEQVILGNLKARAHFLVILTPSALERCKEPEDWLRREIETALEEHRNIVPLMLEGFDFGASATARALTGKLALLKSYNGLGVPAEYFFEAMDRLRGQYLNVALDDVYLRPLSEQAKEVTEVQKTAASEAEPVKADELTAQQWFERGFAFHEANNDDDAIRCYTEAINLEPDFELAHLNRGSARAHKGDLDGAISDFDEGIRLRTNNPFSYHQRGAVRAQKGDLQGAISDFDEVIRIFPNFSEAYYYRGTARADMDDLDGAISDFNEAIRLRPDYPTAHHRRGNVRRDKGDLDGAMSDFDEAIRLEPDNGKVYLSRAITLASQGDHPRALQDLQKAIELDPEDGVSRSSLSSILRALGRFEEAEIQEQVARKLIQKESEYNRACYEAISGNLDTALELLEVGLKKRQTTREWARRDPDFESIRDDPRFKALVGG